MSPIPLHIFCFGSFKCGIQYCSRIFGVRFITRAFVCITLCGEFCRTHVEQSNVVPSASTAESVQKQQSVTDEGMLGAETVRRRPGEPTSKLAADSTLSPKVDHACCHLLLFISCVYVALFVC